MASLRVTKYNTAAVLIATGPVTGKRYEYKPEPSSTLYDVDELDIEGLMKIKIKINLECNCTGGRPDAKSEIVQVFTLPETEQ